MPRQGKTIQAQDPRITIEILKEQARFTSGRIEGASGRREDLVEEMRHASPDRLVMLKQQLAALDRQLVALEDAAARINAQIVQTIPAAAGIEALPKIAGSLAPPPPPPP